MSFEAFVRSGWVPPHLQTDAASVRSASFTAWHFFALRRPRSKVYNEIRLACEALVGSSAKTKKLGEGKVTESREGGEGGRPGPVLVYQSLPFQEPCLTYPYPVIRIQLIQQDPASQ